jgi:hypothetical protein
MCADIRGAVCPNLNCTGFVVAALDRNARILRELEPTTWQLVCPFCNERFRVLDKELSVREVSDEWLKRRYPSNREDAGFREDA